MLNKCIQFINRSRPSSKATLLLISLLMVLPMTDRSSTAQAQSPDESFHMFNALWFKADGGAAKYTEYLQAAGPFVAKHGGKSDASYLPEQAIIGEFDADLVFLVEWPNTEAFTSMIQDPGYQAISHLRDEAIDNSLLIRFRKL
jgi:uncharacterized protein (DUF1330 family)